MRVLKNFIKRIILRKKGVRISHNVDISNVHFEEYCNVAHHAQISNSYIGKRTSIGRYSKIQNANIGKYCSISWDVTIGALRHPIKAVSMHAFSFRKQFGLCKKNFNIEHTSVIIGNDVWIGCNVVVLPGIEIGDGAIIGAGSVVTKNVRPYEIVAGNPAKHIKSRFDDPIVKLFSEIKWWDWDDSVLRNNIKLFHPDNDITVDEEILKNLLLLHKINK